jgi:TP901 family phage tail tape measure protein
MATTYTRRINLYINGKQVSADIVSIRKEMSKLVNEQARMTLGSKDYVKHTAKIKSLKTIIDQHNQDLSTTHKKWNNFQKMADAANRYFAVITAGIAAVAGAVMTVKQTVEAFAEYDDKLVDVMKTTDLTKMETQALNEEIRKINTRTAQIELLELARVAGKLGIRGKEDILGFVNATDKIKVALAEDLGGDTEESVRQLGKLVDIFKLDQEFTMEESLLKIGSAMNALGASGTANEGYMLEFTKRVAGVAPTAGITIDKILGIATTLDELGQTSEVSGTAFNQVISNMFKNTADYAHVAGMELQAFTDLMNEDANEALIQLLIGAKGSTDGFGQLAKSLSSLGMDGVRATNVLGVLAANIDQLRENQKFSNEEFVKGNSLLIEFNKKNNSAQANLEKASKIFKQVQVDLGEKLAPIYASTIKKASTLLKVFGATVEFLFKYGATIVFATGYLITYTAAVKILALWEARKNTQMGLGLVVLRANIFLNRAGSAAMLLYAAAVAVLEGNFKRAAVAMRLFMAFASATPIGLAFTAIAGLILAIRGYDKYMSGANERAQQQAKALKDLKIMTDAYTGHLEKLNDTIKDSNTLTLEQKRVMAESSAEMIGAIENTIRLQKLEQDMLRQTNTRATLWQKTVNIFKSGGNPYLTASLNMMDAVENGQEAAETMNTGIDQLENTMIGLKGAAKGVWEIVNAESIGDKIGTESLVMMNEKLAKYKIALDNAIFGGKDYIRIQQKIKDLESKMNPPKWTSDDEINQQIEVLTAAFNKKQALIRQDYLKGKTNEDEYNDLMLLSELKFLDDKLKIYNAGSQEYQEAVNKALELQVAVDIKLRDLQLKAVEELANAKIENFRDEFQRQEEAEIERWNQEKTALEKQLFDKVTLNEKEQAINDAIHQIIQEKEKKHQQVMADLKTGKNLVDLENMVTATDPFDEEVAPLEQMQESFNARAELIQAQYVNELNLAAGNHAAMLAAEKRYSDAMLQLKLDMVDAEWMQREQRIEAAQSFVTALSGIVDQETALGKALFAFNQGLAIAEIWVSLAKANAAALLLGPGAAAMIPFNTAIAVAQTAMVLAQTVKSFSKPSNDAGYSDGGPTGPGGKKEPAGIVHKGEYVLSQDMLADPNVRYLTQIFEKMRTRRISLSQAAMPLLSSGGFSSANRSSSTMILPDYPDNSKALQQQTEANLALAKAINLFMNYRPAVAIDAIEREREKYLRIKQTSGL